MGNSHDSGDGHAYRLGAMLVGNALLQQFENFILALLAE
jgi:hypothetical protein